MKHDWSYFGDGPIKCLRCGVSYSSPMDREAPCKPDQIFDDAQTDDARPCDTEPADGC